MQLLSGKDKNKLKFHAYSENENESGLDINKFQKKELDNLFFLSSGKRWKLGSDIVT